MNYNELLCILSDKAISQQRIDGAMLPGHNGPYNDDETPTRNTAHWLITFNYMYKLTGEEKYLNALQKCGEYLLSLEARPHNATFFCRKNPNKDFSNGLIGQAWVIEALVEAYKTTNNKNYLECAKEVYKLHPFDSQVGLWKIVNVDGKIKYFDMTFNHQLWFAASLALLYEITQEKEYKTHLDLFFEKINNNFKIYSNGLIKHKIYIRNSLKNIGKLFFIMIKESLTKKLKNKSMIYKENGYHLFNLYAFALIRNSGYNTPFFSTKKFIKSLNYSLSQTHVKELNNGMHSNDISKPKFFLDTIPTINRYGFGYNAPGFEYPFVYHVFKDKFNDRNLYDPKEIFNKQISLTWDEEKKQLANETEDILTLNARVYELTRYLINDLKNGGDF